MGSDLPSRAVSAQLIIDIQNELALPGSPVTVAGPLATVPDIRCWLDQFRACRRPVFHRIRHYRPDGSDVELFRRHAFMRGPACLQPGAQIVAERAPQSQEQVSVVAFPLALDRPVTAVTAACASIKAVFSNSLMMALWGLIVVVLLAAGAILFLIGLAVVLPVLGHATWHLYRKLVEP
jgi:nicotinamidase-related amidase